MSGEDEGRRKTEEEEEEGRERGGQRKMKREEWGSGCWAGTADLDAYAESHIRTPGRRVELASRGSATAWARCGIVGLWDCGVVEGGVAAGQGMRGGCPCRDASREKPHLDCRRGRGQLDVVLLLN